MIIDRFEGAYAVCERDDGIFQNVPISSLPPGAREGDVLFEKQGKFYIDKEKTNNQAARVRKKLDFLFQDKSK